MVKLVMCAVGVAMIAFGVLTHHPQHATIVDGSLAGYATLAQMTNASPLVAEIKVVRQLQSYRIPLDPIYVNNTPQPASTGSEDQGPLKTDFLVQIVEPIKGTASEGGDQIVVTQEGGVDAAGKPIEVMEGNPLLQVGDREIVFLRYGTKYFFAGGPEGRFEVLSDGTVAARASWSPMGRKYDHVPASALIAAIKAAMVGPTR